MAKLTEYKKATHEDKFFRTFVCVAVNHKEIWHFWKKYNRKKYRNFLKKQLTNEIDMI